MHYKNTGALSIRSMSTRKATAPEVRESIEAKTGDGDVEMREGGDPDEELDADRDADVEMGSDAEVDRDAEGEVDEEDGHDMFDTIQELSTYLCSIEEESGP